MKGSFTKVLDKLDESLSKRGSPKRMSDADEGKDKKEPDESMKGEPKDLLDCPHCSGSGKKKR